MAHEETKRNYWELELKRRQRSKSATEEERENRTIAMRGVKNWAAHMVSEEKEKKDVVVEKQAALNRAERLLHEKKAECWEAMTVKDDSDSD